MVELCETLKVGTSWTSEQGRDTHSWRSKLSKWVQIQGKWISCEGGKIVKRGKRGGNCMWKETFHEKVYSRQDGKTFLKNWKVVLKNLIY
jgi:hypothetical protein